MKTWERALPILSDLSVDAMIVKDMANVRYLSGYKNDTGELLLFADGSAYLLTDFRFLIQARAEAKDCEVCDIAGTTYAALTAKLLTEHGAASVAFERDAVNFREYEEFARECTQRLVPADNVLIDLRKVKTTEELVLLRRAESIGDEAFARILKDLRPGVTETEIAAKLTYYMCEAGASGSSFVWNSPEMSFPG